MTWLTIILFSLGIGFLMLGWRWQSPQDAELLTALKGLVHLKRELEKVQGNLLALEGKVERLPVHSVDSNQALKDIVSEAVKMSQSVWLAEPPETRDIVGKIDPNQVRTGLESERGSHATDQGAPTSWPQGESPLWRNEAALQVPLPEKYLKVLELANYGLSLKEIAHELSLSQDAVGLVLRTTPRGGRA